MAKKQENIILETKDLSIGYMNKNQPHVVASNINLNIESGQFICVVGKNGIGKSTLLRSISGVQKTLSGTISLNEKPLNEISSKTLAKNLSLVLTDRIPETQLTVFEIIALGRQPYTNWIDQLTASDIAIIDKVIQQTELDALRNQLFYTLSDGQKQKVFIARALAQDTKLIIMDEPTVHLDLHHTIGIFKLLKKVVKETKKTIIISSHQINLCIQLSDAMVLFSDDEVKFGTTKSLLYQKSFHHLFPEDMITFNESLEQFVIIKA